MESKFLLKTSMGDHVSQRADSIIIEFRGKRNVVSTSNLNGGYTENLLFAYNNSCSKNHYVKKRICTKLKDKTIEQYYSDIAQEIGLPPEKTTGMGTAALMENVAIVKKNFDKLTVTAIVTAGIDVNAGSAGDLARHNEFSNTEIDPSCGTINIFLIIDAKMSPGVLTRAHMTATEAKSAALRELAAPSMYSEEPATGTGTDSLIAIGNLESDIEIQGSGKHSISGQLIGQSVKEAVKKALDKQSSMNPIRQASIIWQGKRYGITDELLYNLYKKTYNSNTSIKELLPYIEKVVTNNKNVGYMVSIFHAIDQHRWGMLSQDTLNSIALVLLNSVRQENNLKKIDQTNKLYSYKQILQQIQTTIIEVINIYL